MRDDQQQLQPFPKKPNTQKYVQFAGPVDEQDFCIPLETISTFQQIREGFSYGNRPLYLLHGPRQFGKTTIAKGVEKWLTTSRSDVMCLFFEVNELVAADETEFWNRLGKLVSKESNCRNYSSFMDLVENCASNEGKKVCLILDKMDSLFSNPDLVTTFLQVLRMWKAQSGGFFLGFLGVGSYELENIHKIFRGGVISVPFNVSHSIKVEPFTTSQMTDFFSLIEHRWTFPASLQEGIMKFSGGAPGVFGSLIRFTLDEEKWTLELEQWEVWFFELRYYTYLHAYNHTYARIQQDLHQLNDEEWWLLKRLLGNDEDVTVMDKAAPRLLRMGVVTERPVETGQYGWKTILAIVSPMMKRVCLDARFQHEKSIKL